MTFPKFLFFSPSFQLHLPTAFKVKHSVLAGILLLFYQRLVTLFCTQRDVCVSLKSLLFTNCMPRLSAESCFPESVTYETLYYFASDFFDGLASCLLSIY
jgi:hypothetical protein